MQKIVLISFLFLFSITLLAQENQQNKIDRLIQKGQLNEALSLVNKLDKGAVYYNYLGTIYRQKGQYDKALKCFNKELNQHESTNNTEVIASVYSNIGVTEWALGNNTKSLDYHFRALDLRKKTALKNEIAASYNDIGLVFSQDNPDKALEYYEKALGIYKEEKISSIN